MAETRKLLASGKGEGRNAWGLNGTAAAQTVEVGDIGGKGAKKKNRE